MMFSSRARMLGLGFLALAALRSGPTVHAAVLILRSQVYVSGFSAPVEFVQDPGDSTVQYVVEQFGRIRVIRNGAIQPADFLNLTGQIGAGGERGLLGLAFSPADDSRFFIYYTNTDGNVVVARYRRSSTRLVGDPASAFPLRFGGLPYLEHPFGNHKAGHLEFGPDGFLYFGTGDGGSGNDPGHRAQNSGTWLGKMLRIDVNVADTDPAGYRVPPSNPYLDGVPVSALPEIWSFGLRNPWKFSFDSPARGGTGGMFIGDVGQGNWEEISYEPPNRGGRNYGWRNREGAHPNVETLPPAYLPLVDPIREYDHSVGASVTGGYVYRGARLPAVRGRYFFADFITARVWSVAVTIGGVSGEATASDLMEHTADLGGTDTLGNVSSFGVDSTGELYIVSYSRGLVLRIIGDTLTSPRNLRVIPAR
jgi:glucose/arabinose dehydrogenase